MSTIHNLTTATTFFEYVGIAGLERLNSQITAWIFSGENNIFSEGERAELLNSIFSSEHPSSNIELVLTEDEYVDLIVETDTRTLLIENKLKIDEHDAQLQKYAEDYKNALGKPVNMYFLTWIGDDAKSDTSWQSVSYEQIAENLEVLLRRKGERGEVNDENGYDYLLLKGYTENLKRLNSVKTLFIKDHTRFPEVFLEGGLKKSVKLRRGELEKKEEEEDKIHAARCFIARTNLETTLQRLFVRELFKEIAVSTPDISYYIAETRGSALVHIGKYRTVRYNDKNYFFCLQFQGNTVKITFEIEDCRRKKDEIIPFVEEFRRLNHEGEYGYVRLNKPRSNGYISISKPLVKDGNWYARSKEELSTLYQTEILNALKAICEMAPAMQQFADSLQKQP